MSRFLSAGESPRPFSEVLNDRHPERQAHADRRRRTWDEVAAIEAEAAGAEDPAEARRLQLEAEALRAALHENPKRR